MSGDITLQDIQTGRQYKITPPCVIGRGQEANLSFSDRAISHRHALIGETNGQVWIEDLQSTNGVFVNELRIREKSVVRPGDIVQIGHTRFQISSDRDVVTEQTVILHARERGAEWRLDQQRLQMIYEIAAELSGSQDITTLGEKIFARCKDIFNHDRAYIACFQEDGSLKPLFTDTASAPVPVSRSIVTRIFENGESLLLEDALTDDSLREQESIIALKIRSAICTPLIYHDQIYGLMYLDRNIPGAYREDDLEFLRCVAFILAPLIENAHLWSELRKNYDNTLETLRKTQSRLLEMERKVAYVRLAQAMAHEIRNPLSAVGGMVRKMLKSEIPDHAKLEDVLSSVERVEAVLKEVDKFVKIPPPEKKLANIDRLIQETIEIHTPDLEKKGIRPLVSVHTPYIMLPVDSELMKKAFSMIFREFLFGAQPGSVLDITIQDCGNEVEISIGGPADTVCSCEIFDPALQNKPWSFSLFLNIANKILSDHGGKILLNPSACSAFPMRMKIPKMLTI